LKVTSADRPPGEISDPPRGPSGERMPLAVDLGSPRSALTAGFWQY
jgi:hypothetical protein